MCYYRWYYCGHVIKVWVISPHFSFWLYIVSTDSSLAMCIKEEQKVKECNFVQNSHRRLNIGLSLWGKTQNKEYGLEKSWFSSDDEIQGEIWNGRYWKNILKRGVLLKCMLEYFTYQETESSNSHRMMKPVVDESFVVA